MKELSLHILDIIQNSIAAEATEINITVKEFSEADMFEIAIADNGKGMDSDELKKATDPFYTSRTTRNIGMGLPLFKHAIELCNGSFNLESTPGIGTILKVSAPLYHIDRQPLGDIGGVIIQSMISCPQIHFRYNHVTQNGNYIFNSGEVRVILDGVPLNNPEVILFVREMITENLKNIHSDL